MQPLDVGEGITAENASWSFGKDTPQKFTSHVLRSVPFYNEGHDLICEVSDFFVKPDSVCYELGVSTGVLTRKLATHHKESVRWVGIDCEPKMIEQAEKEIKESGIPKKNVKLVTDDINTFDYENSDFIVSYYTIQFTHPKHRQDLIKRIYDSLNWGGAYVMFEKVRGADARFQDINSSIYSEFKLKNGYSPEEVIAKSRSLKGVLEPFSTNGNIDLLKRAGFVDVTSIFKWVCFEGFLCIK